MVPVQLLLGSVAERALNPGPMFSPPQVTGPPCPLQGSGTPGAGGAWWDKASPFLQVTEDALVYSTFLLHNPRPAENLTILRTNHAEVPIECRYPRSVWDGPVAAPVQRSLGQHISLHLEPWL